MILQAPRSRLTPLPPLCPPPTPVITIVATLLPATAIVDDAAAVVSDLRPVRRVPLGRSAPLAGLLPRLALPIRLALLFYGRLLVLLVGKPLLLLVLLVSPLVLGRALVAVLSPSLAIGLLSPLEALLIPWAPPTGPPWGRDVVVFPPLDMVGVLRLMTGKTCPLLEVVLVFRSLSRLDMFLNTRVSFLKILASLLMIPPGVPKIPTLLTTFRFFYLRLCFKRN